MITRLKIENFRGFRSFDSRLDRVTAFLGPNSSGKTTALHAIRLACDAVTLALAEDGAARLRVEDGVEWAELATGQLVDAGRLLPLSDWRALFVDQDVGEGMMFRVRVDFDLKDPIQAIEVDVACARNEQLELTVWVRADQATSSVRELAKKSQLVSQRLRDFVKEHAPVTVFVPPFYGTVRDEEVRSRAIIDRLLGSGDQSHVVRNLVVGLDGSQFDQLNAFLESTTGARLTRRTSQGELQQVTQLAVHFRDSNGELELSAAGAGLVNLIALFSALARWRQETTRRRVVFLLDEPEAHLHPRLQAESAARLAQLITREFDAQLLLATHSVDILNRLSQAGALLVRCDRTSSPSAVLLESDASLFDDLASWVDLTPYTAINSLASRRIVFCEGTDELRALPKLAQLRYRNAPAQLAAFRRWALVELGGASKAPLAELLGKLVANDAVRAQAQSGTFRTIVVLDRDHQRTPGLAPPLEREGVTQRTFVWGQHSLESLLLEPTVLTAWVRALAGDSAPADLAERVRAAVGAADADAGLNDAAKDQLAVTLFRTELREGGEVLQGDRKLIAAQRQARAHVDAAPATWQRGKDRARFVLGAIRPHLALPRRNQFPTDVIRLVEQVNLNDVGDPEAALPVELRQLLDLLVTEASAA